MYGFKPISNVLKYQYIIDYFSLHYNPMSEKPIKMNHLKGKQMLILKILCAAVISYLLGCINAAYIYSTNFKNKDIRSYGSGNAGSTNVLRVYGFKPAFAVFLWDMFKGFLAIKIGMLLCPDFDYIVLICAVFVVCGHNWPVFINYRGGKGVATTFGIMMAIMPVIAITSFLIAIAILFITKMMSAGTVIGMIIASVITAFSNNPFSYKLTVALLALFCIFQHRGNIERIFNHTENKFDFGNKNGGK